MTGKSIEFLAVAASSFVQVLRHEILLAALLQYESKGLGVSISHQFMQVDLLNREEASECGRIVVSRIFRTSDRNPGFYY